MSGRLFTTVIRVERIGSGRWDWSRMVQIQYRGDRAMVERVCRYWKVNLHIPGQCSHQWLRKQPPNDQHNTQIMNHIGSLY
ncbi:hypothetical protein Y5S_00592 [Alcanivorax nanhaiticus]|uniref:Uncharacterized protein n=1 Tax=Alcanivorax nanhaiticus TaxID=1177154 RepID=A0A095UUD7_9GAMM|nr:hypothetical protein Y5S_00592 [Alcanivorax nanhaiticus]